VGRAESSVSDRFARSAGATVASPAFAAMDLEPGFDAVSEDEALLLAEGACGEGNGGEEGSCGEGACGEGTCGG